MSIGQLGVSFSDCNFKSEMSGSRRFSRMKSAVQQGKTSPPVDMRYLKKPRSLDQSQRASIVSFLGHLYNSVAETLPDFRDDLENADVEVQVVALKPSQDDSERDPYGEFIQEEQEPSTKASQQPSLQRHSKVKGSKERKMRGSIEINVARKPEASGKDVRWLPPGHMKDMWEQYRVGLQNSMVRPASFTLFWREPLCCHYQIIIFYLSPLGFSVCL